MAKDYSSWPEYKTLHGGRKEIRLLEIVLPSSNASLVECRLSTVSLLEEPSFTTLSYVWGDPALTEDILVDSTVVPVTKNLASALRFVATHWQQQNPGQHVKNFRIWADALCINQRDTAERSQQVQLMWEIYSSSKLMFAWLGTHDEEVALALRALKFLAKEVQALEKDDFNLQWMENYPELCVADMREDEGGLGNRAWTAIWHFAQLKYWNRVWIFQELVLGRKVLFVSASDSLSLEELGAVCLWGQRLPLGEDFRSPNSSKRLQKPDAMSDRAWTALTLEYINWGLIDIIMGTRVSLKVASRHWTLLILCSELRATDPKDHVYGLLGTIEHGLESKISPDYSKTVGQVYSEAFKCAIEDRPELQFLNYAGVDRFGEGLQVPSWTPNLARIATTSVEDVIRGGIADRNIFDDYSNPIAVSNSTLQVDAVELDNVERAGLILKGDMWLRGEMLEYCIDYTSRHPMYKTGVPSLQAIFHVLMNRSAAGFNESSQTSPNPDGIEREDRYYHTLALGFLRHLLLPRQNEGVHLDEENTKRFSLLGVSLDSNGFPEAFEEKFYPDCKFRETGLPNLVTDWQLQSGILAEADWKVMVHTIRFRDFYRFIETSKGYLGLAPINSRPEDKIAVLKSCSNPVLLRKQGSDYILIGTCYILGLMGGEAIEWIKTGMSKVRRLNII